MAKVSVILTVYNKPQFLNECIDSVINQTWEDWELIILEDNSPDPRVREILDSYKDDRIVKYFSSITEKERYETARYATLINIGIKEFATGDYVTYLTDDDFYYPDRLKVMVSYLEDHPKFSVVYGPQAQVDASGVQRDTRKTIGVINDAYCKVDHNSVMHRRRLFDEVGGWDDSKAHWGGADAYFWRKLNEKGYKFYPVSNNKKPLDAKRYHQENVQKLIADNNFFPKDRQ